MINQTEANPALKLVTKTVESERHWATLYELNKEFKEGRTLSLNKWLQRLEKQDEWTKKNYKKAKSYIQSCITGVGTLQEYIIIPINLLILLVEQHCSKNTKPNKIYEDILNMLKEKKDNGCENICLDGQNRGKHTIIPFFSSLFTLKKISAIKFGKDIPEVYRDKKYNELPGELREQIKNIKVVVNYINYAETLEDVRDIVIYKNEGIAWTPHEKRITKLTDVSYFLNDFALHPVMESFYSKLVNVKGLLTGDYKKDRKGNTFMLSEYLYYAINGTFGTSEKLDDFFEAFPGKIEKETEKYKEIMLYLAEQYNRNNINLYGKKTFFDDIFMFFVNLLKKDNEQTVSLEKLGKDDEIIQMPKEFFQIICKKLEDKYNNPNDKIGKDFHPGTFGHRHKGKSPINLKERLRYVNDELIPVVIKFIEDEIIVPSKYIKREYISKQKKQEVLKQQNNKFLGEPVVISKSELDHKIPLSKGGTNDVENLQYVPKKYNREKSNRIA
tara:strand:- start:115 stop:1614 length:1500 start_codon:yes stop_codon:yes gene_type:complete